MRKEYLDESPILVKDFLMYVQNIKGRASLTVDEYYRDLRTFFRYILYTRGMVSHDTPIEEICISNVDEELIKSITVQDILEFFNYCISDRENQAASRARKTTVLNQFFKHLKEKKTDYRKKPYGLARFTEKEKKPS